MKHGQKRKPIEIFLADLVHTSGGYMPLGIGLVASYAIKKFGSDIKVRLFKHPEKLFDALQKSPCDILGCSSYIWNSNLSLWACKTAKKINPRILTCQGGPNFPLEYDQRLQYMQKHSYVDIRVLNEGEDAFSEIVGVMLENSNRNDILADKIKGCVYLHQNGKTLVEGNVSRIQDLELIPSPYTKGLLDEFFDGNFVPIVQTTRGCPFTCNYCSESDTLYSKIKHFNLQSTLDELDYIGERIGKTSVVTLQLADTNYGMYKRDKIISEKINELRKKYNWPIGLGVSTGKNLTNVIETTEILKDTFAFSLSVQSMNEATLNEIGRKNMSPEKYKAASEILGKKHWATLAETIVPLPRETHDSFLKGVLELMDYGAKRIISNTLMILSGTIYKNDEYKKRFGYEIKYRLLPFQFGTYNGEKIFEYEEIGVSTNSLSLNDHAEIQKFTFLVELLFNSLILVELELFIKDCGLKYKDFVMFIYRELPINAPRNVQHIFESFVNKWISEFKENETSLVAFFSDDENYKKLLNGEMGISVKFEHKTRLFSEASKEWIEFVFHCLEKFIPTEERNGGKKQLEDLKKFITFKFDGILDESKTYSSISEVFCFDILKWLNQERRTLPLSEYKTKEGVKYEFYFDKHQCKQRDHLFSIYKGKTINNLSQVLNLIRPQERAYRSVKLDC